MTNKDDIKAVQAAVNQWLISLDSGDLQGMLDTCHPEVIAANEKSQTTVGIDFIQEKYAPRIESATFKSGFNTDHIAIYDDVAFVVANYDVEMTNKETGEVGGGSGRLALAYLRHSDGSWKMILDIDNNA